MRTLRTLGIAGLVATSGLAAACGDNTGPDDQIPAALVATWVAEPACSPGCSFTLTSVSNANAIVDLVAAASVEVELRLTAQGGATLELLGETIQGTARVEGNTLLLSSGGSTDTLDYIVTPNSLDLRFRSPVASLSYDFNGDQVLDPAHVRLVMKRE